MNNIIVSVIIPIYNEGKYISAFLKSLICQTYPIKNMEWIFVDGMSEDDTVCIIKEYEEDYPVKILVNTKRKTPYALNIGIQESKGKYIIRLDAHAFYANNYIERCVFYLETMNIENVGGIAETRSDGFTGCAIAKMLSTRFGVGASAFRLSKGDRYVDTVPFGAFRRSIFNKVGLFNTELLRSEDNDINSRIRAIGGKIWLASDIKFIYFCRDSVKSIIKMAVQNGNALFHTLLVNKSAMSIRHFVPFIFLMSLIVLPLLGLKFKLFWILFCMEIMLYFIFDLYFSFCSGDFQYGIINVWLYPLFHISYGFGSLVGLLGVKMY